MSSLPRRRPPKHVITVHSRTGHHKLCPRYCRKDSHTRTNRAQGQCPELVLFLPVLVYSFIPIHLLLHSPGRRGGGSGGEMRGGRGEVMSFSFRILVSCSRRVCCCCAVLKLVAFKCSCRWFYLATKPHFSWSPEDIRQRTPIKQEKAQTGTRRGAAGSVVMTRRHFTLWTISFMLFLFFARWDERGGGEVGREKSALVVFCGNKNSIFLFA